MSGRGRAAVAWLVCALTLGFVLIPLAPALLGRGPMIDVGLLSGVLPFRAEVGRGNASVVICRLDTVDYYMPGVAEIKRSLFAGHFPTWAPYEVGGAPLASLPNHAVFSPLSLPYLVLPLWLAPAYVKLLEFAVAIVGMVLFLRRLGITWVAGLLAGVVFAGSGFMIMWTNWPHTRVAALIPALFWALERVIQEVRARDVVLLGVVVASMLLGGFPAIVLFSLTLAGPYAVLRTVQVRGASIRRVLPALAASAGGVLLGVGLSGFQILPFAANLSEMGFDVRDKTGDHLPLYTAFTLLDPYAVGTCVGGVRFGDVIPIEAIGFVGAATLVLAATAWVLRSPSAKPPGPTGFLAVSAMVLGVAIWVGGPVLTALQLLPLWSSNRAGRAQSVFGFLMAVLAGIAFDRLYRGLGDGERGNESTRAAPKPALRAGFVVAGLVLMLAVVTGTIVSVARREGWLPHLVGTMALPLLTLVLAVVAVVIAIRGASRARVIAVVVVASLVIVPSTAFARTLLPVSRMEDFYPVTPTHEFLAPHLGPDRYGANSSRMYSATSDYYELRTPVGHEFTAPRWRDLLHAVDPQVQRTATYFAFSDDLPVEQMAASPLLDRLAVRYWVLSPSRTLGEREKLPDTAGDVVLATGDTASCTVPGGPLRGIRIQLRDAMQRAPDGTRPKLDVTVTGGGVVKTGSIMLDTARDPGRFFVAVAGEDLPESASADVQFRLTDVEGTHVFRGTGDHLDCAAVRPSDDGLRLVQADAGGAVYERLNALPRIRWASTSRVVAEGSKRVAMLKAGIPDDTVLIEDQSLPAGENKAGTVEVLDDERGSIRARVRTDGAGYLVVADSIVRPGWYAAVDGTPAALVNADHAFAAVPVPAGEHVVELHYVAPGLQAGVLLSAVSVLLAAVPVIGPAMLRRRRRTPSASGGDS